MDRRIELYGQTHIPATALYRGRKDRERERERVVIGGVGGRWGSFSCWAVAFIADLQISPPAFPNPTCYPTISS